MMFNKDGVEVKIGQVWRDCDKRTMYGTRTVEVVGLNTEGEKVQVKSSNRVTWISLRRMYKHATGYVLVTP